MLHAIPTYTQLQFLRVLLLKYKCIILLNFDYVN